MVVFRIWGIDHESTIKAFGRSEFLRSNLVAHRTGHAVFGLRIPLVVRVERQTRKDLAFAALQFRLISDDRHVAYGTLVLNASLRFRMVNRLASHAGLPIGISRRIGHDAGAPVESNGDVFPRCGS